MVDNTFLSPASAAQPIRLGADLVVHSTTKFLNGHSDVVGGMVIAADQADVESLKYWANVTGVAGSPFDAFLTLRGIRTLFARVESQQRTTTGITALLDRHPAVRVVHYPGLPTHPGYEIAKAQQTGFGSMLSFEITGGVDAVCRFVETVRIFSLVESLGGIESLVSHPATMTSCKHDFGCPGRGWDRRRPDTALGRAGECGGSRGRDLRTGAGRRHAPRQVAEWPSSDQSTLHAAHGQAGGHAAAKRVVDRERRQGIDDRRRHHVLLVAGFPTSRIAGNALKMWHLAMAV